jgi:hypothetical protein
MQGRPVEIISSFLSSFTAAGSLSLKRTFSFAILKFDLGSGCKVKYQNFLRRELSLAIAWTVRCCSMANNER